MSVLGVLIPHASKRQNEPDSTIGAAISFILLAVVGRISQKQQSSKPNARSRNEPHLPTSPLNRALDFLYNSGFIGRFQGHGNQAYYFTKIL